MESEWAKFGDKKIELGEEIMSMVTKCAATTVFGLEVADELLIVFENFDGSF